MSLISFQKKFSTEEACHDHLFTFLLKNVVTMPILKQKHVSTSFMNAKSAGTNPLSLSEP
jgi:hypothetical protein